MIAKPTPKKCTYISAKWLVCQGRVDGHCNTSREPRVPLRNQQYTVHVIHWPGFKLHVTAHIEYVKSVSTLYLELNCLPTCTSSNLTYVDSTLVMYMYMYIVSMHIWVIICTNFSIKLSPRTCRMQN